MPLAQPSRLDPEIYSRTAHILLERTPGVWRLEVLSYQRLYLFQGHHLHTIPARVKTRFVLARTSIRESHMKSMCRRTHLAVVQRLGRQGAHLAETHARRDMHTRAHEEGDTNTYADRRACNATACSQHLQTHAYSPTCTKSHTRRHSHSKSFN